MLLGCVLLSVALLSSFSFSQEVLYLNLEIRGLQPGTGTTTSMRMQIVQCYIKVAGGIVTVVPLIQMVCIRVEVTLKESHVHHFEDKIIL